VRVRTCCGGWRDEEDTYFILMFGILAVTALLAEWINLPGIVGTFLAGLAVNAAVKDKPAKGKLAFMGNTLFIPIFFIGTGLLIDPFELILRNINEDFLLAAGIIGALDCRQMDRCRLLWSRLRLRHGGAPNNMVADAARRSRRRWRRRWLRYKTFNAAGQPLLDSPHAQRGADHGAGHGDPGAGLDATLRAAHAGGGEPR
jgi:hypothetical protein